MSPSGCTAGVDCVNTVVAALTIQLQGPINANAPVKGRCMSRRFAPLDCVCRNELRTPAIGILPTGHLKTQPFITKVPSDTRKTVGLGRPDCHEYGCAERRTLRPSRAGLPWNSEILGTIRAKWTKGPSSRGIRMMNRQHGKSSGRDNRDRSFLPVGVHACSLMRYCHD